jgi:hypothetical protein
LGCGGRELPEQNQCTDYPWTLSGAVSRLTDFSDAWNNLPNARTILNCSAHPLCPFPAEVSNIAQ